MSHQDRPPDLAIHVVIAVCSTLGVLAVIGQMLTQPGANRFDLFQQAVTSAVLASYATTAALRARNTRRTR